MNENSWLYWRRLVYSIFPIFVRRFHEWKFMALLKVESWNLFFFSIAGFPWMKIHGSIEGRWPKLISVFTSAFPWMKIHGSIEGQGILGGFVWDKDVSMNENSWLYWRKYSTQTSALMSQSFHEWKFMALLKESLADEIENPTTPVSMNENSWLYWRTRYGWRNSRLNPSFHEWKFMALLKAQQVFQPRERVTQFPWMKIHGSIEGQYAAEQDTTR